MKAARTAAATTAARVAMAPAPSAVAVVDARSAAVGVAVVPADQAAAPAVVPVARVDPEVLAPVRPAREHRPVLAPGVADLGCPGILPKGGHGVTAAAAAIGEIGVRVVVTTVTSAPNP